MNQGIIPGVTIEILDDGKKPGEHNDLVAVDIIDNDDINDGGTSSSGGRELQQLSEPCSGQWPPPPPPPPPPPGNDYILRRLTEIRVEKEELSRRYAWEMPVGS